MSLFGDMFAEEPGEATEVAGTSLVAGAGPCPPAPRLANKLCGIFNQGATCYMNSLLQTMVMTPEFRHALFSLGPEELGSLNKTENNSKKARVIPLQLQRLFARLMLLSAQGCSTSDLTDSFGWTNNEGLQQHDAQELNRILFSAIEDSLIGTSGHTLIPDLYEGVIVNQTECNECKNISSREEKFRDLCMTVGGMGSLEDSLVESYISTELLAGDNQYRCEHCSKLVNATKGAKLRRLPPILTFSLLRFSFDYNKMERFKETGKYVFPLTINMSPFCESESAAECLDYEIFSILIHRGSTHGGHYHAYIRDIENLGQWTHPDHESIQVATDPATGQVDFIEYDSPLELIQALLAKSSQAGMNVDKLCAELVKQTGVSWNKRFKRNHGPITKFLKKYDDTFVFNPASNWVSLKTYGAMPAHGKTSQPDNSRDEKPLLKNAVVPESGRCWFDFNDSRVYCVEECALQKQFSGAESAYMLFYRRKDLCSPEAAVGNPSYGILNELLTAIQEENIKLDQDRHDYSIRVNTIHVQLHFASMYTCTNGALRPHDEGCCFLELEFDQRKLLLDLISAITEMGADLVPSPCHLHILKHLGVSPHLYECVSDLDGDTPVAMTTISNNTKIFIWDGEQVDGYVVAAGAESEPVLLNVSLSDGFLSHSFPANTTLKQLRDRLSQLTGIPLSLLQISRLNDEKSTEILEVKADEETISSLKIKSGDHISVQHTSDESLPQLGDSIEVKVEPRLQDSSEEGSLQRFFLSKHTSLGEVKARILSQLNPQQDPNSCRLRVLDDNAGLQTPLPESLLIEDAGLNKSCHFVLELGQPPSSAQILLRFTWTGSTADKVYEITVERSDSIKNCLSEMCKLVDVNETEWHLCTTNWFGESTKVLDDLDMTLEQCHIRNGDFLSLQEGKLPPKGCIKLFIWLHSGPVSFPESIKPLCPASTENTTSHMQNLSIHGDLKRDGPIYMGEVIISKDSSLTDLKIHIMALPLMEKFDIPNDDYLRVRIQDNGVLSAILKGGSQSLQRLRLACDMALGVQVLQHEELLSQYNVVLNICLQDTGSSFYGTPIELVWDVSQGAFPDSLRQAISALLNLPATQIKMAKHFPDKYEWMVITNTSQKTQKGAKGRQKKQKASLRHAPYHLKDGDTIGVKVGAGDEDNDFASDFDRAGQERLKLEAEEKRKKRMEARQTNPFDQKRRPEVGIKIHVDSFS